MSNTLIPSPPAQIAPAESTAAKVGRLKQLAQKAGACLFERIALAAQVLADDDYLEASFGGDRQRALETLEGDYFPEASRLVGLATLLGLYQAYPQEEKWRECKYNVAALLAEYETTRQRSDRPTPRRATLAQVEDLQERLKTTQERLKAANETLDEKSLRIMTLESELAQLREDHTRLKGRFDALEAANARLIAELRGQNGSSKPSREAKR